MKPIIFNTEMVKAILDGRKRQFRKVIKYGEYVDYTDIINEHSVEIAKNYCTFQDYPIGEIIDTFIKHHGKYKVGDILYVKETFIKCIVNNIETILFKADGHTKLDGSELDIPWKTSVHLKEQDARIFLKVTSVRVEKLQDIDNDGFFAEGFKQYSINILLENLNNGTLSKLNDGVKKWWVSLWNSTAKDGYKWEDNPYVFVYEFERVKESEQQDKLG